jgi:hypothetical protein
VERVIAAHIYIFTRMEARTALTNQDIACNGHLATEQFYAETFTFTVAAVI